MLKQRHKGFSSEAYTDDDCFKFVEESGTIFCLINGYFGEQEQWWNISWTLANCKVGCNGREVRLPESVCPNGRFKNCDENAMEKLRKWSDDMKNKQKVIEDDWCSGYYLSLD
ncbi:uncharacterized protein LOC120836522 [Ixodes scapularis]|uniref:uncharacterized protein LOC120836522 n=1 Tax=Ixodes scapularis TaxID=6945 RepID=UPI001A9DBB38|nr:uncharacterized protein LOC120836522 [Ixodes scapularis]